MAYLEGQQFIHGVLEATISEATHLHHQLPGLVLQGAEALLGAFSLDKLSHSKIYATIDIGKARVARTRAIPYQPQNPKWDESFRLYVCHHTADITISLKNQLPVSAAVIGRARIPVDQILTAGAVQGWFDLYEDRNHEKLHKAKVLVSLKFTDVGSDPSWGRGVTADFSGVADTFFPMRRGCDVTLYQNAHLSSRFRPPVELISSTGGGEHYYQPQRLWEDVYKAIVGAKQFVYVSGWSVNVATTLVRDKERMIEGAEGVSIGELLKRRAEDGLRVLVMVWQDKTSNSLLGTEGQQTHDEDTRRFFEGTKVKCFLSKRHADHEATAVQHLQAKFGFTHHQKTVTLDAGDGGIDGGSRKVVSFVGGVDLCDGRYDDEEHVLFQGLDTVYADDFQQKNFPSASLKQGGPREPWHDIHSKVEGAAAWDVLNNFEQRWKSQAPPDMTDSLLNIRDMPGVFQPPPPPPPPQQGQQQQEEEIITTPDSWNVQVLRSIDDTSLAGFPSEPAEAKKLGLVMDRGVPIDRSIQSGYVEAIRRARSFIYIENQYFMGSSASWKEDQYSGCLNVVPLEIAAKIASKIRAGERFTAYIITPMWPEGEPSGEVVQTILHWNRLTMEMMYAVVAKAIEEMGLRGKAHPQDYLNFFCLGNRELPRPGEYVPPERPEAGSDYSRAQTNRRFLIYVHAKLMIVDDEYIILGSANLNQRSLAGDRDTEIAHGSYQPHHLNASSASGRARGAVHGFRMSLWYEHLRSYWDQQNHRVFLEPQSLDCVRKVRQIAEDVWEKYVAEEVTDLPGHLLPFPITVSEDGTLGDLPADGCFPDTKGPVRGKKSDLIPNFVELPPFLANLPPLLLLTT